MDQTFMTIHDLGADANILFASDSITEILGYQPHEVLDKSSFDYFHPDEVPFARSIHSRGVLLDKAAVLHYARLRSRNGQWVSCECCFTIVHDVLVACISVYQKGEKSQRRAVEAPQIRRLFSCSPKDPRYHMLQHLSPKFELPPAHREPRAALILNRFTRSLSIMFSTNAIASILGLAPEDIHNKSFYECIQESCLEDAVRCLESAKANDSIAYLRFWSRDPRRAEEVEEMEESEDEEPELDGLQQDGAVDGQSIKEEPDVDGLTDGVGPSQHRSHDSLLSDSDSGGVPLDDEMDLDSNGRPSPRVKLEDGLDGLGGISQEAGHFSTQDGVQESSSSANSMQDGVPIADGIRSQRARYSRARGGRRHPRYPLPSIELEAVVSCTSDGLVVILRKARPPIPTVNPSPMSSTPRQGIFAAPWGQQPIRPQYPAEAYHTFQAPLMPQTMPVRAGVAESGGPPLDYLMESIREVAVFAWAVVGINGNLASYGRGRPLAGAQPSAGLPIWDPSAGPTSYQGPENEAVSRWAAFESGRMPWPNRGGQSIGSTPGANGTGRMMKSNGNTRFTSNGYNNHNPRGQDNFAPNGGRNFLSNGHNTHMPNGHAQNGHNGHNGHNVNGHNGYTPNGPSNYTVGSNMWSQPSQQTDGSSTNGHEQRDVRNGRNNAQPNGHNWNGMPTEIGWNLFSHAQHDGITDGNSTTRNSSGSHPRRWPQ